MGQRREGVSLKSPPLKTGARRGMVKSKEPEDQLILSKWKVIGHACGGVCVQTIRKLAKQYHMPVKMINQTPHIDKAVLLEWFKKLPRK
jgi:hypothetical protein